MENEEVEFDIVDEAIYAFLNKISGDDDESFEEAGEQLYDLIDGMVEEGLIEDLPTTEASEEEKQEWVAASLPVIEEHFNSMVDDGDTNS